MTTLAPVATEIKTTLRCSHPHPRIPNALCNAKLAVLTPNQLDHIKGVPIWCWKCHKETTFE